MAQVTATTHRPTVTTSSTWTLPRIAVVAAGATVVLLFPLFAGLEWLAWGPVPYFIAVIAIVTVVNVWRANPWTLLAGGILLALFMGLNLPFIGPNIVRPDHAPDYAFANVGLLAAAIGLVGGIFAVVQRKAPRAASLTSAGAIALLVAAGFSAAVIATTFEAQNTPPAGAGSVLLTPEATVPVVMEADKFLPATVTIPANQIVKIPVTNNDAAGHVFNVDELSLAAETPGGKTTDIWIEATEKGTYQLYCVLHAGKNADGQWEGMVGTFVVE